MPVSRIAVTGGTGFVGGAVIKAALDDGWEVHSFGRREVPGTVHHYWEALEQNESTGLQFDAVIHCAAAASDWGNDEEIAAVNISGTREALLIDPEARFIHISTGSVYQPNGRRGTLMTETTPRSGSYLNAYARSKSEAEELVLDDGRKNGSIILRPHAIYGSGDMTLLPRVEKAARRFILPLPDGGRNLISLTRIDTLVSVVMEMICQQKLQHRVFNVADGNSVVLKDALKEILRQRGKRVLVLSVPSGTAWSIGHLLEWIWRRKGIRSPPPLTRYLVSQLGYTKTYDLMRVERQLGREMPEPDFSDASAW
jgi:nucleoside-diphosphate-sugar epimerase